MTGIEARRLCAGTWLWTVWPCNAEVCTRTQAGW